MTLLRLSPLALSRSRFALSPLAETFAAMKMLIEPAPDPWAEAWHARHAPVFAARLQADPFEAGFVRLAHSTKWLPDLVAFPPRGGMTTRLADELPAVAAYPAERFPDTVAASVR